MRNSKQILHGGQTVWESVWRSSENEGSWEPQPIGMGRSRCLLRERVRLTPRNTPLLHEVGRFRFVLRLVRNYGDLVEKFDSSLPAFQGQPRSLEPARIDRQPMTFISVSW